MPCQKIGTLLYSPGRGPFEYANIINSPIRAPGGEARPYGVPDVDDLHFPMAFYEMKIRPIISAKNLQEPMRYNVENQGRPYREWRPYWRDYSIQLHCLSYVFNIKLDTYFFVFRGSQEE